MAQLNCPDGLTFPEPYKEVTDASGNVISATGRMVVDDKDPENKDVTNIKDLNQIKGKLRTLKLFI